MQRDLEGGGGRICQKKIKLRSSNLTSDTWLSQLLFVVFKKNKTKQSTKMNNWLAASSQMNSCNPVPYPASSPSPDIPAAHLPLKPLARSSQESTYDSMYYWEMQTLTLKQGECGSSAAGVSAARLRASPADQLL